MNFKLFISILIVLLTSTVAGQNLKIDTFILTPIDTGSSIRWICHARPSILSTTNYPLLIINGQTFENCVLQNIFFELDTNTIANIQVLNPQDKSVVLYGTAGSNGVIIINTKTPIQWVSLKQILKQRTNKIYSSRDKTLIKVDEVLFDTNEELYFQKNLIQNISVINNTTQYYNNRQFTSVVKINMRKKSGT